MKPSGPGLLSVGRFLITVLISVLVMGLIKVSIFSWFSFGRLYFSQNLSISFKMSIIWHIVADSSLMILCISMLSVVISPVSFLILLI